MSWSVSVMGVPEKVVQALDAYSETLSGQSLQEYEEAKTRLEFLTAQEADLVQSLDSLNQAIKKINRTSRKRFAETFEAVNHKFKEVFGTLFNGGRAELVLLDETNLLETGVDVVAQPP